MTEPVLRAARPDEAAALSALKLATFRATFLEEGFAVPYPPDDLAVFERDSYAPERVAAELADAARRTWVAERAGRLVGYVQVGPCKLPHPDVEEGAGEIYQLYLERDQQGAGLGGRLLDVALDHLAVAHRGRAAWLGVWSGNAPAQAFYARRGFRRVGGYGFPVGAWIDREYILRRDLPAA